MASIRMPRAANLSLFLKHAPRLQSQLPPPFLVPFAARSFNSTTPIVEDSPTPELPLKKPSYKVDPLTFSDSPDRLFHGKDSKPPAGPAYSPRYEIQRAPRPLAAIQTSEQEEEQEVVAPAASHHKERGPLYLTPSVRENLVNLACQPPFYITTHIHGHPYLVTVGDTIRLPFLMHGVMPGDVLRLDRASVLGSRDWTLRGGAPLHQFSDPIVHEAVPTIPGAPADTIDGTEITVAEPIIGKTEGLEKLLEQVQKTDDVVRRRNAHAYLDDRLYVCRAVVMGTEIEPLRIKEKTKKRQRHIKRVKSQHQYTVLKIREISVNSGLAAIEEEQT